MEEKELFEDYEIKNWEFTPRLFKVFGAGTLVAFCTVFAFGQFNLMQSKACDNAIVGTFCQVLDAAYIATTFAQQDGEWSNRDYDNQKIEDADVTFVDVSAVEPPLQYPEGYFALANPEQYSQMQNPMSDIPGQPFPTNPTFPTATFPSENPSNGMDNMLTKPAELPQQNNSPVKGDIPTGLFSVGDEKASAPKPAPNRDPYAPSRRRPKTNNKLPNNSPKLPSDTELANTNSNSNTSVKPEISPSPLDSASAVSQFNEKFTKKPFQDFAENVIAKTDGADKIDLTKPFMVELQGVLDAKGKFDAKKTRFVDNEGDPKMIDVAKSAIEAINNSGILVYLSEYGVEKINITLTQDQENLSANIIGNMPSETRANSVSSGMRFLVGMAKNNVNDPDLLTLINTTEFTSEKKDFVMKFKLKKDEAHKLIDKKLQEARIKKSQNTSGDVSSDANAKTK